MAVTYASFIAARPEFVATPEAQITAAIADATRLCSAAHFRDDTDAAVSLYTAHLLALSPFGKTSRKGDSGETTYLAQWTRLARARAGGPRAVGV
jgi:hypothetical protein